MKTFYGYMRVSTKEQNEDRQRIKLLESGIYESNIFLDKKSGKDFERAGYKALLSKIDSNSVIFLTSLDRLGRNYEEIIEQWKIITLEKKADIVILDMPLLDTRNKKDLLGTFMTDLVLSILSYVAETERQFIRSRQKEGIFAAKQRGVKFGRPKIRMPDNFCELVQKWKNKEIALTDVAKECNLTPSTFYRRAKELQAKFQNL